MYSLGGYGAMISDAVRMDAYAAALREVVMPGSVVLDIGAGTGICALLACRLGARRVYAIEPGDAIHVAREIAEVNDCAETIEFIQALSTEVSLPERADVIVSDLRGVLPLHGRHLPAIADARRRLLAPGGTLIPLRDTLWVACVEAEQAYEETAQPWAANRYGLDMRAALPLVTSQWSRVALHAKQLLGEPARLGILDYAMLEDPDFKGSATLVATRKAAAHGLCVWFDAALSEGVSFSNAPGNPGLIYGHAFFPWPEPLELQPGDEVAVAIEADLVGEDYLWRWETRVAGKTAFKQSSFFGQALSPAHLRKLAASFVPCLNEDGDVDQLGLELMRAGRPLGDIARQLAARFPQRFARWQDALTHVGALSARYSR